MPDSDGQPCFHIDSKVRTVCSPGLGKSWKSSAAAAMTKVDADAVPTIVRHLLNVPISYLFLGDVRFSN